MSALGHKRTFREVRTMSALPPKSGHQTLQTECPLSARSGHRACLQMKEVANFGGLDSK